MEIWFKSKYIESTNRLIASQPQSRAQVVEIPYQEKVSLSPVEYGELLITVLKGTGIIETRDDRGTIGQGDQVYLVEGDEFGLVAAGQESSFLVQIYWTPNIIDSLA